MPRLFVGIMMPNEIKNSLIEFQNSLSKLPIEGKVTESRKIHLTLSFLGNVSSVNIEEISDRLELISKNYKNFSCKISTPHVWPSYDYMKIIGLYVKSNNKELDDLRKEIKKEVGGESFTPHITVYRVRKVYDRKIISDFVSSYNIGEFIEIEGFQLIKVTIGGRGPKYEVIKTFKFG